MEAVALTPSQGYIAVIPLSKKNTSSTSEKIARRTIDTFRVKKNIFYFTITHNIQVNMT